MIFLFAVDLVEGKGKEQKISQALETLPTPIKGEEIHWLKGVANPIHHFVARHLSDLQ